jgi:cytidylate kinase
MIRPRVVAIDGAAGSGKSSLARAHARARGGA